MRGAYNALDFDLTGDGVTDDTAAANEFLQHEATTERDAADLRWQRGLT